MNRAPRRSLLRALRTVARAESSEHRTGLYTAYRRENVWAQLAEGVYHRLGEGAMASALVFAYGMKPVFTLARPRDARGCDVWLFAEFPNDERRLRDFERSLPGLTAWMVSGPKGLLRALCAGVAPWPTPRQAWRAFSIVSRFNRGRSFFVSCRVARAFGAYVAGRRLFRSSRPAVLVVSSDFNADAVGLTLAAHACGVKSVYAAHAHPSDLNPPLIFDLAVLSGPQALDDYSAKGAPFGACVFSGAEGSSKRPINAAAFQQDRPRVGLFAPKEVSVEALERTLAETVQSFQPQTILLRWHPNMLQSKPRRVIERFPCVRESPPGSPLEADIEACDWVISDAGSNVHLAALAAGVPSVAVEALAGAESCDRYGFVRDKVVPPPVAGISSARPESLTGFYADPEWVSRFSRYDAAYLRPRAEAEADVAAAVARLARGA